MDAYTRGSIYYDVKSFRKILKFDVSLTRKKTKTPGVGNGSDEGMVEQPVVCIQCKNLITKDLFTASLSQDDLKMIGFHNSIRGYFNRIRAALACTDPELRCYFWYYTSNIHHKKQKLSQGDYMALLLQQKTKFDDDLNWVISLQPVAIKMTEKLGERLEDIVAEVQNTQEKFRTKLTSVVEQVRDKFNNAESESRSINQRMDQVEEVVKKIIAKVKEHQKKLEEQKAESETMFRKLNQAIEGKEDELSELQAQLAQFKRQDNKRAIEVDKKLIRWKTRAEFKDRQSYTKYVNNMLDTWDQRYGRVLVCVSVPRGKTANMEGRIGQPLKWRDDHCWVKWLGDASPKPDSYEWESLEIFFPDSAFYYPRVKGVIQREVTSAY